MIIIIIAIGFFFLHFSYWFRARTRRTLALSFNGFIKIVILGLFFLKFGNFRPSFCSWRTSICWVLFLGFELKLFSSSFPSPPCSFFTTSSFFTGFASSDGIYLEKTWRRYGDSFYGGWEFCKILVFWEFRTWVRGKSCFSLSGVAYAMSYWLVVAVADLDATASFPWKLNLLIFKFQYRKQ